MKQTDIRQGRRVARLIDQLTRNEMEAVVISFDNPEGSGPDDCLIFVNRYEPGHPKRDENGFVSEEFRGRCIVACLLDALKARGLVEENPPDDGSNCETNLLELKDAGRRMLDRLGTLRDAIEGYYENCGTKRQSQADLVEPFRFLELEVEALAKRLAEDYDAF